MKKTILLFIGAFCLASCGKKGAQPAADTNATTDSYVVSTLAGGQNTAYFPEDGTGPTATFSNILNMATDVAGNIYVTDDNLIRKITPTGVVTTLFPKLKFNALFGITTDAAGNFYISDENANIIEKITQGGVISSFAGNGIQGSLNGISMNSEFSNPRDMVSDASNNFYIIDGNTFIRKISSNGLVSIFANIFVKSIAIDALGNIYAASIYDVYKITPSGTITLIAGNSIYGSIGGATNVPFTGISSIAVDPTGNIYVLDGDSIIRKITPSGVASVFAGNGTFGRQDGPALKAEFGNPHNIIADAYGNIYVSENNSGCIRKISKK
jgi:serine/threonine-protein kinase